MKKLLLIILISGIFMGAGGQHRYIKMADELDGKVCKASPVHPDPDGSGQQSGFFVEKYEGALIGQCNYDLQTYGSMQKRMYAYPDGSVAATWMMGYTTPDWPERGAGYNYFDGTSWGPMPTSRVESVRTGWPCYAPLGPTGEMIVSHYQPAGSDWALLICKRAVKGQGTWEESTLEGPGSGVGIVWPDVVTSGPNNEVIHILANSYGDPYNGQAGTVLYYRSTDAGQTWDITHFYFDDLGPSYFQTIGGNDFAWAEPRGTTIAFTAGFLTEDGVIMKSLDNGETWQKIVAFDSPYTPYPGGSTPTFGAGDGTAASAIGPDNKVHVAFGRMLHYYDESSARYYYPSTEGMIYWNEDMPPLDTTTISTYTFDYLIQGGNLAGWVIPFGGDSTIIGYGSYEACLTSFPQINIDDQNNIFLAWSAVAAGFTNSSVNYRHIQGRTFYESSGWSPIEDYNQELVYLFSECVYPSMSANFAGGFGHLLFQWDGEPGIHVWLNGHPSVINYFEYKPVNIDFSTGIREAEGPEATLHATLITHPVSRNHFIRAELPEATKVGIRVRDLSGRLLYEENHGMQKEGPAIFEVESSRFRPGIYYCTLVAGVQSVTMKMVVNP